jgi:hypothetical protein
VPAINSFLRVGEERGNPHALAANEGYGYKGSLILGQGFTLSNEERDRLVQRDSKNSQRVFPYLGGEEVNTDPRQHGYRFVINFGQMSLEEAHSWPDLLAIVRERVKPERERLRDNADGRQYKANWWKFGRPSPALYEAIGKLQRCLVTSEQSTHLRFAFQPVGRVFSHKLYVFPLDSFSAFATLQSRVHLVWARFPGLSRGGGDTPVYSVAECFETFPFPCSDPNQVIPSLEKVGTDLYEARAQFMIDTDQGLTQTYNHLKDATCDDSRISKLRELHEAMDRAVLDAYGWKDIEVPPFCPKNADEQQALERFQDVVIDRLFVLNARRAEEEKRLGAATATPKKKAKSNRVKKETVHATTAQSQLLFDAAEGEER